MFGLYTEFSNDKSIKLAPATLLWLNQQLDASAAINNLIYQELEHNIICSAVEEELEISREQVITLQQQLDIEQHNKQIFYYQQLQCEEQLEISQEQIRGLQLQIQKNQQEIAEHRQQTDQVKSALKNLLWQLEVNQSAICML
ncbi:hypothetical protein [Gloeocapsopsis sp. IPPAS B-1203]|uniref:hypothetical protein n=1 Tax=Gloeocapsopsis sp. IPPAS B-1203 TaxID=2049454 RepID=UPI000C18FA01|nr:hypothetical protein [Gloeocapsopsis sp. IPPAS B-1203]PIG92728.1 hypothetical protein CSQ79_14205 [Gloeocapsopsis sp. IPPAS B-1203]